MKLRSMIFKLALALLLSSIATLIADMVLSIIVPSNLKDAHHLSQLILSLVSPIAFSVIIIYLLHIYNGNGESEVCEEYPDKYPGIFKDIPKVILKERLTLLSIIAIGLFGTLIWFINSSILHSKILERFASLLLSASSLALAFPSLLGYLLGTFVTAIIYVFVYALFRFKWRKFM
jgi:hypothetical protein